MNFFKKIILLSLSFFFILSSTSLASYGLDISAGVGINKRAFNVNSVGSSPQGFMSSKIGSIIGAALAFVGVIFMVLIIFGGLTWMTAGGNENQVQKAQKLITQAVVGLIIVLAAYAITNFLGKVLI